MSAKATPNTPFAHTMAIIQVDRWGGYPQEEQSIQEELQLLLENTGAVTLRNLGDHQHGFVAVSNIALDMFLFGLHTHDYGVIGILQTGLPREALFPQQKSLILPERQSVIS